MPICAQCSTYGEATCLICSCKMCQKQLWESDISRKNVSQWPAALLKVSLFQKGFLTHFAGLNPLNGTIGVNGLIIPGF